MEKNKLLKIVVVIIVALAVLISTAKNLDLRNKNNIFDQMKKDQISDTTDGPNRGNQSEDSNNNDILDDTFEAISSKHEGLPVLLQEDEIQNEFYGYVINSITKSKELGDFQNPTGILGHVDEQGNTTGPYSYLIINLTIECFEEKPELYLNTLKIFLYKDDELARGYEALTSNNTVPMTGKSGMRVVMTKGDTINVNIVYLVDDEYVEDAGMDFYLFINNRGASLGDDIENKRLVKLNTKELFQ